MVMSKLLGLLALSGSVLAALFFMTHVSGPGRQQDLQAITLTEGHVVEEGAIVSIEYSLTDESGNLIESNVGKEPMTYVHGGGQIVPGLEKGLAGLKVGAEKKITVSPEEGYGPVNPQAFQEIPKDKIPPDAHKVDAMLMTQSPDGRSIPMRVREVKENTVIVDFNHPLAGKTLIFDVTVKEIKKASMQN